MSKVTIQPKQTYLLKDLVVPGEWQGAELLGCLAIRSVDVDGDALSWVVALDVPDKAAFAAAARSVAKEQFDVLLAVAGQEIRKKIEGLDQVRWAIPEGLEKSFKVAAPKPANGGEPRRRSGGAAFSRGGSLDRAEAIPMSQFTGGEKQRVSVLVMV